MLEITEFRKKFPFQINYGVSDYDVKDLIEDKNLTIDFNVYLPSKKMNLQRGLVWTQLQKEQLIISILKSIQIPPVTAIKYRHNHEVLGACTLKIIDGKQRLSTLMSYLRNEFPILHKGQDYFVKDLSPWCVSEINNSIKWNIGYEYPDKLISDELKIQWFEMINFAGTPQDKAHLTKLIS